MKLENRILIEDFLSEIQAIIESNYLLDDDGNIILKVPKNLIREQCMERMDEYAKELEEPSKEVKEYLLKVINNLLTEEGESKVFQKEYKLVKQILTSKEEASKNKRKNSNEDMER